jgi:hypothetical protein
MFTDTVAGYFRRGRSKLPLPDQDSGRGHLTAEGRQAVFVLALPVIYTFRPAFDERVDETIPERARTDA